MAGHRPGMDTWTDRPADKDMRIGIAGPDLVLDTVPDNNSTEWLKDYKLLKGNSSLVHKWTTVNVVLGERRLWLMWRGWKVGGSCPFPDL